MRANEEKKKMSSKNNFNLDNEIGVGITYKCHF